MLTKVFAPIAIAGTVAGGVLAAPAAHATYVDVNLLADTAFFVGPTVLSTPSATFAQTAADLYLHRLGFDAGDDPTACVIGFGSVGCDAPLQILTTPALVQQGHSSFVGAAEIVRAVHAELNANPDAYDADHPLWIFGWSQGATAGSIAMAQLAHDGVNPDALHFVFIGNPVGADTASSDMGGGSSADFFDTALLNGVQTPNDAFTTTDYAIPGDPVTDPTSTSAFGLFYEHMMYLGLTPEQVADQLVSTDGAITDIDISGEFDQFGAWLNAWSHGLVDSSWWEGLFYSVVASIYSAFGNIEGFFGDWLGVDWGGVEDTLDFWFPEA